jgi:hypothetical protein
LKEIRMYEDLNKEQLITELLRACMERDAWKARYEELYKAFSPVLDAVAEDDSYSDSDCKVIFRK